MTQPLPPPSNLLLPRPRTRIFGRESELAAIRHALVDQNHLLVSLVGPGGVGKTRLAQEIGWHVAEQFADGVVFVDLSRLQSASQVLDGIARAVGVQGTIGPSTDAELVRLLRPQQRLLILDNFEHVLDAVPETMALLGACPALQLLVTSRALLRVRGERTFPVEPLPFSTGPIAAGLAHPIESPAVGLLVERAREGAPDFELTAANAETLREICTKLDGLPLAIELAAPRLRMMSPGTLLAMLSQRLCMPADAPRDAPIRHRSLHAAISWSSDLLSPRDQASFRRLSVFVGGFDLVSAAATLQVEMSVMIGSIEALLDQSLLQRRSRTNGEPRFTMLETVREFAAQQLSDRAEEAQTQASHATYFLARLEEIQPTQFHAGLLEYLDQLEVDYPNFRAALAYFARTGNSDVELQLVSLLGEYWMFRGSISEGLAVVGAAIERASGSRSAAFADVLSQYSFLHFLAGNMELAQRYGEESVALLRQTGDAEWLGGALEVLALTLGFGLRQWSVALELLHEAEQLQSPENPSTSGTIGKLYVAMGQVERGIAVIETTLPIFRAQENWLDAGLHLLTLGQIEAERGRISVAAERFAESMRMLLRCGATNQALFTLSQVALLTARESSPITTARLLGMAARFTRFLGVAVHPNAIEAVRFAEAETRRICGAVRFRTQFEAGFALPLSVALEEAIAITDALARGEKLHDLEQQWEPTSLSMPEAATRWLDLTRREKDVLALMARRRTDAEIAAELFISYRTVTTHVSRIIEKLGASNRRDAAAIAARYGLV